jgi:hypothetical protein
MRSSVLALILVPGTVLGQVALWGQCKSLGPNWIFRLYSILMHSLHRRWKWLVRFQHVCLWRCVQGYKVSTPTDSISLGSTSILYLTILPANGTLSASRTRAEAEAERHQTPPRLPEETHLPLREALERPVVCTTSSRPKAKRTLALRSTITISATAL